jgi:hypothetical protein
MPKAALRQQQIGMYFDLRAGFSGFSGFSVAVASVGAWGTIWLRSRACDESTPQ